VAEPFHLLDCCVVSNGGVAVIVTTGDRARSLAQPPVPVLGWAQAHPGHRWRRNDDFGLVSGTARSGPAALKMAGVAIEDVDVTELYDCYTFTVLLTLEDYGFCKKGEGRVRLDVGRTGPGWLAAAEHRRRAAIRVLHVGHDPALRGGHPGSWPSWGTPGGPP
jgi:acetyl-CoA acetyltransferase